MTEDLLNDKDYGYLYRDIMKCIGNEELTILEISERMYMAYSEMMDWLHNLVREKILIMRIHKDGHRVYKN